jgi:hypothetical protein
VSAATAPSLRAVSGSISPAPCWLSPKGKRDLRFRIGFGIGKEAIRERTPGDANVISMDERRKALEHGA